MAKRLIAVFLACTIIQTVPTFVFAQETQTADPFYLDIGMLSNKQLQNISQNFVKLDISSFMNRDIKDEIEGDGTGGWSDQGDNDLRMFDQFGAQEMLGVPFDFVNPALNGGKAVLALRGQNDEELPTMVDIPINRQTNGAYFIQASPYCSGTCGVYTWVYEDGTEEFITIDQNEEICDFWGESSYDYVRPAWTTVLEDGSKRSLYLFAMNNPHPDKRVKSLRLETTGSGAYIMIMAITLTDNGPYLPQTETAKYITTSTYGWYDYEPATVDNIDSSIISASKYLDKPAGKHGSIQSVGESFEFEDGTKVKFWGTEIVGEAVFPDKTEAESIAKEIARCGFNLVRFSGFDECVLDKNSQQSTELDEEKMDRLCFFMDKLKEQGVYISFSLLSERKLRPGDGIENYEMFSDGYGIDAYFDERLIELQNKFNNSFFGYENKYTNTTIGQDNAVVFVELVDGLSIFDLSWGYGRTSFANSEQREKLKKLFNEYLSNKYSSTAELLNVWTSAYDKNEYETLENRSIEIKANTDNTLVSEGYLADLNGFYLDIANHYFESMQESTTTIKALVTLNSNDCAHNNQRDLMSNSRTDFVTRKFYDARNGNYDEKITVNSILSGFEPITENQNNIIRDFSNNAVYGKPYLALWGSGTQNLYFSSSQIMVPAFAAVKGWSAIQHTFANGDYKNINYIDDFYEMYNNPVRLALAPIAASIFYTLESENSLEYAVDDTALLGTSSFYDLGNEKIFKGNHRISFKDSAIYFPDKKQTEIIKTNDIYWDSSHGFFEMRSDIVEAVTGILPGKEELPTFIIDADNSYLTAALLSLDDKDLQYSEHYLFTVVGSAQNRMSKINLDRDRYETVGEEGILVETITGSVTIKRKGNIEVYSLTSNGERKNKITVMKEKNGYSTFELSKDDATSSYEILVN